MKISMEININDLLEIKVDGTSCLPVKKFLNLLTGQQVSLVVDTI